MRELRLLRLLATVPHSRETGLAPFGGSITRIPRASNSARTSRTNRAPAKSTVPHSAHTCCAPCHCMSCGGQPMAPPYPEEHIVATFPNDRHPNKQQSARIFTDVTCRTPASLTTAAGAPIANSTIAVGDDGLWPFFKCTATIVYFLNPAGQVTSMVPNITAASSLAVTGVKSTGAAVTSLIAALASLGLPLTDSTT